jgi:hypothetical protein
MSALAEHLKNSINTKGCTAEEISEWLKFCKLLDEIVDLENAFYQVSLSEQLTKNVISKNIALFIFYKVIVTKIIKNVIFIIRFPLFLMPSGSIERPRLP